MSIFHNRNNNIKFCQYFKISKTVFEIFVTQFKEKLYAKNGDHKKPFRRTSFSENEKLLKFLQNQFMILE